MARATRGNRYGQQADEHPRPHIDVPMSIFGEMLFSGRHDLVGLFVHHWCHCVWKKDPTLFLIDLSPRDLEVATLTGFVIVEDGKARLTGPHKDPNWLLDRPRVWWTYAIEAVGQGVVKIGRSLDPAARLLELQKASAFTLSLLGKKRGDIEQLVHSQLKTHRVSGEWFTLNDEVMAVLVARKVVRR